MEPEDPKRMVVVGFCPEPVQSRSSQPKSPNSILWSSHLRLPLPWGFRANTLYTFLVVVAYFKPLKPSYITFGITTCSRWPNILKPLGSSWICTEWNPYIQRLRAVLKLKYSSWASRAAHFYKAHNSSLHSETSSPSCPPSVWCSNLPQSANGIVRIRTGTSPVKQHHFLPQLQLRRARVSNTLIGD